MKWSREDEEIAEKIARQLAGAATEQDLTDIETWKTKDKHHKRLYEEMTNEGGFHRYETAQDLFPADEGWSKIKHRIEPSHGIYRWRPALRYAAVALLCIACSAIGYYYSTADGQDEPVAAQIEPGTQSARLTLGNGQIVMLSTDKLTVYNELNGIKIRQSEQGLSYLPGMTDTLLYNRINTLRGMEYQLLLSDSSRIHLNAESCLKYPVAFLGKERSVELEGEAYFSVAPDKQTPFIVKVGPLSVRVVGTTFNVRAYPDEHFVQIALESGCIEVEDKKLTPGELFTYDTTNGKSVIRKVETKQYTAWHEGRFLFRNERLEDILRTLARWYRFDYCFDDEAVKDVRIGAYFQRYNSMEPIINMLVKTDLAEVSQKEGTLHFASASR